MIRNIIGGWRHHPVFRWAFAVFVFVIAAELLMWALVPALWAGAVVTIGDKLVIDLGDLPQWGIAVVAILGLYKSWRAEKQAFVAVGKIEEVRHETNSMRTALEAAKVLEGRKQVHDEIAAAATTAGEAKNAARAEGVADAEASARVRTAEQDHPAEQK